MSRVGKKQIPIPGKTTVSFQNKVITVKGEKGSLSRTIHPAMELKIEGGLIQVVPETESRTNKALQGMTRSVVANMVTGVSKGFERVLEINGIGYRAELSGNMLTLHLGYSHPVQFSLPQGITATAEKNSVKLFGIDKEQLGEVAASVRRLRKPEPYKGKGIKYAEEHIQRKAGKTGTK
jgi:large subunit ribosomal protein L6